MYIVIPIETLKRTLQRDLVKNQRDKLKRNAKNVQMIQRRQKRENGRIKNRGNKRKNKMVAVNLKLF